MLDKSKLTIEQMSNANFLLQKLVNGINKRWAGDKNGLNSYEAYEIIIEINNIIAGVNKKTKM